MVSSAQIWWRLNSISLTFLSCSLSLSQEMMITLPGEFGTPLPANVSALTPSAQARHRLGEFADSESICLRGGTAAPELSPLVDGPMSHTSSLPFQPSLGANSFFAQGWGMPPMKRGESLQNLASGGTPAGSGFALSQQHSSTSSLTEHNEEAITDSPSFLESLLA